MKRESEYRRGTGESGWDLPHFLALFVVLGLLASMVLLAYFLVIDSPVLPEQSRYGEYIGGMIGGPMSTALGLSYFKQ